MSARLIAIAVLLSGSILGQTAAALFDSSVIHDIRLTVTSEDWAALRANYLENTYYPAAFEWNGNSIARIGIRSRGSGSRSPHKPNLLLSFRRYERTQRLLGLETVVLKANNQDASLMRELIAMQFFQRMGIPAPREAPARLFINGEYFGAYTLVESIEGAFLERNYGESAGYLYEWERDANGYFFEDRGSDPAAYSPVMWSPKNHESDPDPAPIVALVQAVNDSPEATWEQSVSPYLDVRRTITYLAAESFLTDFDGFLGTVFGMDNLYFYRFTGSTLSEWIPWDKDGTFQDPGQDIFQGTQENVFARRALRSPSLRAAYFQALRKAATLAGGADGWVAGEIERLYTLIGEIARIDPHKQCSDGGGGIVACGAPEFEQEVEYLRQFAARRAGSVEAQVALAGVRFTGPAPAIFEGGVVNAANPESALSPGALVSLFGSNLAAEVAQGATGNPPRALEGVLLFINGARAPLLYVSPGQINAQIPWDTTPGPASFAVTVDGVPSNTVVASIGDFGPGILAVSREGGSVVLYGTGFGAVNTGDGRLLATPVVTLDGLPLDVSVVPAPELAGVFVVTVALPPDAAGALTISTPGGSVTTPLP
ncbi:MAG TPA: CotH kinase family protein [Bryobacteraceae bacterium]|nr:CotH kinase family protein [Bryobacteraceae bacterium]